MLPNINPENTHLRNYVGEFIYEYVEYTIGEEQAPKITGMIIDLPCTDIKSFLYDFYVLYRKIF